MKVLNAVVRIRTLRGGLQGMRRQIHAAAATFSGSVDQMPGVQEAGSESVFHIQFAKNAFDFGRKKGGIQRA